MLSALCGQQGRRDLTVDWQGFLLRMPEITRLLFTKDKQMPSTILDGIFNVYKRPAMTDRSFGLMPFQWMMHTLIHHPACETQGVQTQARDSSKASEYSSKLSCQPSKLWKWSFVFSCQSLVLSSNLSASMCASSIRRPLNLAAGLSATGHWWTLKSPQCILWRGGKLSLASWSITNSNSNLQGALYQWHGRAPSYDADQQTHGCTRKNELHCDCQKKFKNYQYLQNLKW